MKKKILIGSIIAVVILVLVSFTGVFGYQTTKSFTIARASPLFSIRTSRAIDKESKDLTCDYVGKGEEINIPLPKLDYRKELLHMFIEKIIRMDDTSFDKFIGLAVISLQKEHNIKDEAINEIVMIFEQLRNEPMKPVNYSIFQKIGTDNKLDTYEYTMCDTICGSCPITEYNPIICLLGISLLTLIIFPILLVGGVVWLSVLGILLFTVEFCPS